MLLVTKICDEEDPTRKLTEIRVTEGTKEFCGKAVFSKKKKKVCNYDLLLRSYKRRELKRAM